MLYYCYNTPQYLRVLSPMRAPVVRIDLLPLLAGCRKRRLNQDLSIFLYSFFQCVVKAICSIVFQFLVIFLFKFGLYGRLSWLNCQISSAR